MCTSTRHCFVIMRGKRNKTSRLTHIQAGSLLRAARIYEVYDMHSALFPLLHIHGSSGQIGGSRR